MAKNEVKPEENQQSDDSPGAIQADTEPEGIDPVDEQVRIHEGRDQYIEDIEKQIAVFPEVSPEVTLEDLQVGNPEVNTPEQIDQLKKII